MLLKDQGRLAGAESLDQRALDASERTLGEELPSMLVPVNNFSALLKDQGKLTDAGPLDW